MNTNTIDAALCAKMFLAAARNLEAKKEWINELNVFPVPDGDTGTNMTLTIMSAAREVSALDPLTMESFAKAVSSGSLRGARGNSGVILSQLLRGFTKVIRKETEITPAILVASFQKAVETAYKAVMKPKEGTILTVARGASERAAELLDANPSIEMSELISEIIARAEDVLNRTPEMLPVLKEAGVVDSGGQGLVQVLKGAYDAFLGIEPSEDGEEEDGEAEKENAGGTNEAEEKKPHFEYCAEFLIHSEMPCTAETEQRLKTLLEAVGTLLEISFEGGTIHVHIHTDDPGRALTHALSCGSLTQVRIGNMRKEQGACAGKSSSSAQCCGETVEKAQIFGEFRTQESSGAGKAEADADADAAKGELKEVGFISVSIGDGIADIFRDLGVDYLIEGGQTMNPSTEDMLNAIERVNAKTIFILPNNKNIILAANQAKSLTKDKNIIVVPTKTVPQGITAVINYVPEKTPEENAAVMEEEIAAVKTGQLTYAVRDTHIDDKIIRAGDIMGVGDHAILAVGKEISDVAAETVRLMMSDEAELISIYYGEDMSEEEAGAFRDEIAKTYPDCEVELNRGGQPIYYYIISVE